MIGLLGRAWRMTGRHPAILYLELVLTHSVMLRQFAFIMVIEFHKNLDKLQKMLEILAHSELPNSGRFAEMVLCSFDKICVELNNYGYFEIRI